MDKLLAYAVRVTTQSKPGSEQFLDARHIFAPGFWPRLRRFPFLYTAAWILLGWATLALFASSYSEGASPLRLLLGAAPARSDNQRFGWFFVYGELCASVGLLSWLGRGLRAAAGALERSRPLAGVSGEPPRCRACQSPLAPSGALRRCAKCGADHLVWSGALPVSAVNTDQNQQKLRAGLSSASRRLAFWLAMLPVAYVAGVALAAILSSILPAKAWLYPLPISWGVFVSLQVAKTLRELSSVAHAVESKPATQTVTPVVKSAPPLLAPAQLHPLNQSKPLPIQPAQPIAAPGPVDVASARCTSCGGSIPIQFSQMLTCPFCGARDAIEPGLAELLRAVRERIGRRVREQQQFAGDQQVFTQKSFDYARRYIPLYLILWALITPLYYVVINSMKPTELSLAQFLLASAPISGDGQYAWAFFFAATCNLTLTLALPAFGLIMTRQIVLGARAVAPSAPGAPPRCRCCLAELPDTGVTRRCAYCGADHLVLDDQYRQQQASLDLAIDSAMAEGESSLRDSLLRNMGYVSWALALVVVLFPVTFFSAVAPLALIQWIPPAPWLLALPFTGLVATASTYVRAWSRLKKTAFTAALAPDVSGV